MSVPDGRVIIDSDDERTSLGESVGGPSRARTRRNGRLPPRARGIRPAQGVVRPRPLESLLLPAPRVRVVGRRGVLPQDRGGTAAETSRDRRGATRWPYLPDEHRPTREGG